MSEKPKSAPSDKEQVQVVDAELASSSSAVQKEPKRVTVTFKTWLSAGPTFLTAITSIAAACSALFSWQQSEITKEVVTLEYRNAAFIQLLEAYENLCNVNINRDDPDHQQGMPSVPIKSKDGVIWKGLAIDVDAAKKIEERKNIVSFDNDWREARYVLLKKVEYLSLWETNDRFSKYLDFIVGTKDDAHGPIVHPTNGVPSIVNLLVFQSQCIDEREKLMQFYKGNENIGGDPRNVRWVPIPFSKEQNAFEILKSWKMKDVIELLREPENKNILGEDGRLTGLF